MIIYTSTSVFFTYVKFIQSGQVNINIVPNVDIWPERCHDNMGDLSYLSPYNIWRLQELSFYESQSRVGSSLQLRKSER